jgi:hypothetical protein
LILQKQDEVVWTEFLDTDYEPVVGSCELGNVSSGSMKCLEICQ